MRMLRVYQINSDVEGEKYLSFASYNEVRKMGKEVTNHNYNLVYIGEIPGDETLDSIYERCNLNHPEGYKEHSMSVSDVILIESGLVRRAFYVDTFRFKELDTF